MRQKLLALLDAIDEDIANGSLFNGQPQRLYIIGAAAIVLNYKAAAISTLDIDLTDNYDSNVRTLPERYGKNSDARRRFGVYIDFVNEAYALLPPRQQYTARAARIPDRSWQRIEVFCIEATDLIISKLKRFRFTDRRDIRFLIDHARADIASHELEERLAPLEMYETEDFDKYKSNLSRVRAYLEGKADDI